jgi:hypothetical protein
VRKDPNRQYLVLSEVLKMLPPEDYNVRMSHIGNLFILDRDKDGRFTVAEFVSFAEYCRDESVNFKHYEFNFQLQAKSTLRMWKELQQGGEEDFAAWVGRLLYESCGVKSVKISADIPHVAFVGIEAVKLLYDVMEMKMLKSFTVQNFLHLLQQAAEEAELMPLECKDLDNMAPLCICQNFAKDFLFGFSGLFKEIGLHKNAANYV